MGGGRKRNRVDVDVTTQSKPNLPKRCIDYLSSRDTQRLLLTVLQSAICLLCDPVPVKSMVCPRTLQFCTDCAKNKKKLSFHCILILTLRLCPRVLSLASSLAYRLDRGLLVLVLQPSPVSLPSSCLVFRMFGLFVSSFRWSISSTNHRRTDRTSKQQPCPLETQPAP